MDIHISGNRASSESTLRAHLAPLQELPKLSAAQIQVAIKLRVKPEEYARSLLAFNLEEQHLRPKVLQAANLIERLARSKFTGLHVEEVWLNTFEEEYHFKVSAQEQRAVPVLLSEDLIDKVLESGSASAEHEIVRILEVNLPEGWAVRQSEA